jgi:RHS repeat-associated protein
MLGFRAVDLVAEYTGHPYDNVLSAYFAEARMYDAADRRFLAADSIKGNIFNPLTLAQYTYVLDSPMNFTDPLGKYFIEEKRDKDGTFRFFAVKQNVGHTLTRVGAGALSMGDVALDSYYADNGIYGGNSINPNYSTEDLFSEYQKELAGDALEKWIKENFGKTAGKLVGFAGSAYGALSNLYSYGDIAIIDGIVFDLFSMIDYEPKNMVLSVVEGIMDKAYRFVYAFRDYFLSTPYSGADFYFRIHENISKAKDPTKKIKSYYDRYYREISQLDVIKINGEEEFKAFHRYPDWHKFISELGANYKTNFLEQYKYYLKDMIQAFKKYMNAPLYEGTSLSPRD